MISQENEKVPFYAPIQLWKDPSVEKWMIEIEQNMKRTLRHSFKNSFESRQKSTNFETWLFDWPGQVALMVECVNGTIQTEEAIDKGTIESFLE